MAHGDDSVPCRATFQIGWGASKSTLAYAFGGFSFCCALLDGETLLRYRLSNNQTWPAMTFPNSVPIDPGALVSAGVMPGFLRASGLGYNPDVDTGSVPEDAWGGSGLYNWMPGLTSLEMVSTSPNDTAVGTGARAVIFLGLDDQFKPRNQTIATNGIAAVPLPLQAFRNNGGRITLAGATGTNEGDIILRDAGGGVERGRILAGTGTMRQAPYTVPFDNSLEIFQILTAIDSPGGSVNISSVIATYFRSPGAAFFLPLILPNTNSQPYAHEINPPIFLAAGTDFSLRIMKVSDNNAIVTAGWNGLLKKNT